jgi:uncharacterized protein (DUF58 family)
MKQLGATEVDPRLQPLLDRAALAALVAQGQRLARSDQQHPADSGRHGGHASRQLGGGLDFAEHRRYQPGDDPRRIDWRVTARIGQPHVRRYHEDLSPECVLLVDRRASMRFATHGRLKVTQAVRLAVLLAAAHVARQTPLSLLTLEQGLHRQGPLLGTQLLTVGQQLAAPCPPGAMPGIPLSAVLAKLVHDTPPGSRIFLISDFADADSITRMLWQRLGRQHRVSAVVIADPVESQPPGPAPSRLCWEDHRGEVKLPLTRDLARQLAQAQRQRRQDLRALLGGAGITLDPLATVDEDLTGLARRLLS